jgi:HEPN domain-containing protein
MILSKYGHRKANAVCYHCHQAAEKYLKGYLIAMGISEPPFIHNLPELMALCAEFDQSFSNISLHCYTLNPYGIRVRYPDEIDLDEIKMRQAIIAAKAIQIFPAIVVVHSKIKAEYSQKYTVTTVSAVTRVLPKQDGANSESSAPNHYPEDMELELEK